MRFQKYKWLILIFCICFALINIVIFIEIYDSSILEENSVGALGEFIGGYIGTLFALVSVLLLYLTFKIQRESSIIEKFETKYFALINLHRENVAEIRLGEDAGRKVFVLLVREFRAILEIVKQQNLYNDANLSQEQLINFSFITLYYGVGPHSSRVLRKALLDFPERLVNGVIDKLENKSLKKKIKKERNFSFTPFEGHQSRLGHYFRHLYQTITYVHHNKIEIDKYEQVKTMRAQLSNHEQVLLFFNSVSNLGNVWKKENLITKYRLIKNIPKSFIDEKTEIDIKKIYPCLLFEYEETEVSQSD